MSNPDPRFDECEPNVLPEDSDVETEVCPYCDKVFPLDDFVPREELHPRLDYPYLCWGCSVDLAIDMKNEMKKEHEHE
jgi:hypothetical protein